MKRFMLFALVGLVLAGCSGVVMNTKYSKLLDTYVTLAEADAKMAINGAMDANDMRSALIDQYGMFKVIQDARDGKETDVSELEAVLEKTPTPR